MKATASGMCGYCLIVFYFLSVSVCLSLPFLFIPPSGARRSKGLWISGKRSPLGQKTRQGEVMKDKQLAANTC